LRDLQREYFQYPRLTSEPHPGKVQAQIKAVFSGPSGNSLFAKQPVRQ
jgi:hypothetical protein